MARPWLNALLGASLFLGGAVGAMAAAETVQLTPEQMRSAAHLSIQTGNAEQAVGLTDALLQRNPNDIDALILKSQALRDLGRYDESLDTAKQAYGLADTDDETFAAAMVRAQALASMGARTRAQIWLRMAGQFAPDDEAREQAIRDFRYVRSRNKWNTQLSFSVAPTSNVNNGSVHDQISSGGLQGATLSGDAQALSGLSFSAGMTTRYRFSEGDNYSTEAGLHLFGQTYLLSDDAKAQAPDAKGSDYAYTSVAVGLRHLWQPEEWKTPLELTLLAGRARYEQEDYSRYYRADLGKPFVLGKDTVLRLGAGAEQFRRVTDDATSLTLKANATLLHEFENGADLRFSVGYQDTNSDWGSLDRDRVLGGVGYTLPKPIGPARVTLQADFERTVYPAYPQQQILFGTGGPFGLFIYNTEVEREDINSRFGIQFWFDKIDYYGFSPTMTLSHSETRSNLDLYDTVETGIDFGFRSSF